ncbi:MAG TPA: co-chaperone GroES family protein [Bacteroidales bacterium]|nr:co-chaperone GroES family protein [Bacteroidales bacterium]
MKPTKILGKRFLATEYEEQDESGIITPDTAEKDTQWVRIDMKGEDMSDDFSEGDLVLISPVTVARAVMFEFDGVNYALLEESNIVGTNE